MLRNLVDRVLLDSLDFVRRWLFFWESNGVTTQPFRSVRSFTVVGRGRLSFIVGRDTPRAVRTWIFSPVSTQADQYMAPMKTRPLDIHFYLDECRTLTKEERESIGMNPAPANLKTLSKNRFNKTHSILIMEASHHLNKLGQYTYGVIYQNDFDFGRTARAAKANAQTAIDLIAKLGAWTEIKDLSWDVEVREIHALVRGIPELEIHQTNAHKLYGGLSRKQLDTIPTILLGKLGGSQPNQNP